MRAHEIMKAIACGDDRWLSYWPIAASSRPAYPRHRPSCLTATDAGQSDAAATL